MVQISLRKCCARGEHSQRNVENEEDLNYLGTDVILYWKPVMTTLKLSIQRWQLRVFCCIWRIKVSWDWWKRKQNLCGRQSQLAIHRKWQCLSKGEQKRFEWRKEICRLTFGDTTIQIYLALLLYMRCFLKMNFDS